MKLDSWGTWSHHQEWVKARHSQRGSSEGNAKASIEKRTVESPRIRQLLVKVRPRLSEVAQPLRVLSAKEAKFIWSQQDEDIFKEVRELVVKHPMLKCYDLEEEVTVQCDASEYGLGAALLQNGHASRSLSQTEAINYAQI